jgi:hypothetical protein
MGEMEGYGDLRRMIPLTGAVSVAVASGACVVSV